MMLSMMVALVSSAATLSSDAGLDAGSGRQLDGGRGYGPYDAGMPTTWRLSAKLKPDSALRDDLIRDLTAPGIAMGELPLTRPEAMALIDDPRAEMIYADRTIAIVAPSMIAKQRQDHVDVKKLFLKAERINAGAAFARQHQAVLSAVEAKTKVSREVIVGILMWETKLGTITGDYHAFNVFTSQSFFIDEASAVALSRKEEKKIAEPESQKRRVEVIRERARRNLLALARQCKAKGIDTLEIKGSWAGALGYPQFMPASLRWADDGNGDGKIDLFDFDDSIASVGRYLAENGWVKNRNRAVWSYNHEAAYVEGVLAYADALHEVLKPDGGPAVDPLDAGD